MIHSTNPYRRKYDELYGEKHENICLYYEEGNLDSVHHIEIRTEQAMENCVSYFPNVTELFFGYCSSESCDLIITNLNRIIPLKQLTIIVCNRFSFEQIIEFLCFMPNIHTLKLSSMRLNQTDLISIQQSDTFQLISTTNIIRSVSIEQECTPDDIQLLLAKHIRLRTFRYPDDSQPPSIRDMSKKIERISNTIKKIETDDFQQISNAPKNPFSFLRILLGIGLLALYIFGLPIIVFYIIYKSFSKEYLGIGMNKRRLLVILLSIIGALVACIVYLTIINVALFHAFYDINVSWHVSSLEVYWPFVLIIAIVTIAYIYESPLQMNPGYVKNEQLKQYYDEAELDYLKHHALVQVLNGKEHVKMTLAEFERQEKSWALYKFRDTHNKNFVNKMIDIVKDMYEYEKQYSNWWVKLLEVVGLIVVLTIAVTRACVPTIYRTYNSYYTFPNTTKPFQVELINTCYYIIGLPLYFIYMLMIMYGYYLYYVYYNQLHHVLKQPANNNPYGVPKNSNCGYFLDLRCQSNLELFFAQLRNVTKLKDTLRYQLVMASFCGAIIFALILGIVAFIQILYYQVGGLPTLTTLVGMIDVGIIFVLVIIFLFNVVVINTALTNVQVLLLNAEKDAAMQSAERKSTTKQWNVRYLGSMTRHYTANITNYTITIFGFLIDTAVVVKIGGSIIGSFLAHLVLYIKKHNQIE